MPPTIFTTGYEQHARPEDLVERLATSGVRRLIDVRELPLSRRRGFSKTKLGARLADAGIAYEHVRALGNPKPLRDLYRSGRQAEGERGYLDYVRNASAPAVDDLAARLGDRPTCVMCFEEDHRTCHRTLLVSEIEARLPGLQVCHL